MEFTIRSNENLKVSLDTRTRSKLSEDLKFVFPKLSGNKNF